MSKMKPLTLIKYDEYIERVKNMTIYVDADTHVAYIDPDFKHILTLANLGPEVCEDLITWDDIITILSLETERWNKCYSNVNAFLGKIAKYLDDALMNQIEEVLKEQFDKRMELTRKHEVS